MFEVHSLYSAMARVQRLVSRGMWFHVNGIIALDKADSVLAKFNERYHLIEPSSVERRRQRRGEACARVTLWGEPGGVAFVINASSGSGAIHVCERLVDCREAASRIFVRDYELVRLARPGDGVKWTWRMRLDVQRAIADEARHLARRENASAAQSLIDRMLMRPGFNGVRTQRTHIICDMQIEARRAGRRPLVVPAVIPWIRACHKRTEPFKDWLRYEQVRRTLNHAVDHS